MKRNSDEDVKYKFIEAYRSRTVEEDPNALMDKINVPRYVWTQWISDVEFQRELEQIDAERAWLAKEVVYRKVLGIFENISNMALGKGREAIRAAELASRIVGILKAYGGGSGRTSVTINNTLGNTTMEGMSLEELTKERDEIAGILAQLTQPAEITEKDD